MSSTRNTLAPYAAMSAGDLSQATVTSATVNILRLDNIGIQINSTGAATGSFAVNCSNDAANWFNVVVSPPMAVSGSNLVIGRQVTNLPWNYLQVVYTKTSGTGAATVLISGRGN